jgi:hypothetical protein
MFLLPKKRSVLKKENGLKKKKERKDAPGGLKKYIENKKTTFTRFLWQKRLKLLLN